MPSIPDIYTVAMQAAVEASKAILAVYQTDFIAVSKEDGSPVTQADIESSKIIREHLTKSDLPIMGEEREIAPYSERQNWKSFWCMDPLDGTKMFLKRNGEFCINIAHVINGRPVFGLMASPTNNEMLFGGPDYGVFICSFDHISSPENWFTLQPNLTVNNPATVICSRSYTHGSGFKYMQILERSFGELHYIRRGSAMKFFDLAKGNADVYPCFAKTMEWDIAAGHAILNALGGDVVAVKDNRPLRYNKEDLYNPPFIAKTKAILNQ